MKKMFTAAVALLATLLMVGVVAPAASAHRDDHKADWSLSISRSADRSDATQLDGAHVAPGEEVAIFVSPLGEHAHDVDFYINDHFIKTEHYEPYDLAGTNHDGTAALFSADHFYDGENHVKAVINFGWWRHVTVYATVTKGVKVPTIADIATSTPELSTLVTALTLASDEGPIDFIGAVSNPDADLTVFAPTNDAFEALGDTLDAALADPAGLLTDVLAYHVLGESKRTGELVAAGTATTLEGSDITITRSNGTVFINDIPVLIKNIPASNGIVHVIDAVLLPPAPPSPQTIADIAIGTPELSTLVTALTLASDEGPIDFIGAVSNPDADLTVFAPTNDAFEALGDTLDAALADPAGLLTDVLAYHVLGESKRTGELVAAGTATTLQGSDITITRSNGTVFINDIPVLIKNIPAVNGIVHVIDAVLLPPAPPSLQTIADIAIGTPELSTLVTALTLASDEGPIDFIGAVSNPDADLTVFAPTNDAFEALGDTLDAALADPAGLLTDVLAYHVLGESKRTGELVAAGTATTLEGSDITITRSNGTVFINDIPVLIKNIPAVNGIVHVIDAVLLPTLTSSSVALVSAAG